MKGVVVAQSVLLALSASALWGCRPPGKPGPDSVVKRPDQITDFSALYQKNCQACHGVRGEGGTAVSLANPAYIAYAGREHIAEITAKGIGGSLMPAFANEAGGTLTDQQIQILADGIVSRWGRPASLGGVTPPPYESHAKGQVAAGEALYRTACLRCHAPGSSSILDPAYLALISDGGLRTLLVAGKPHEGMPDWRGYPGGPLTDGQLADLVAFLASHRTPEPGQPFPNAQGAPQTSTSSLTPATPPLQSQPGTNPDAAVLAPKPSVSLPSS